MTLRLLSGLSLNNLWLLSDLERWRLTLDNFSPDVQIDRDCDSLSSCDYSKKQIMRQLLLSLWLLTMKVLQLKSTFCRRVSGFSHLSIYVIFLAVCPPWLPGWVTLALRKRGYLMLCFYNMFSLMNDKEGRSTQRVLRVSSTINLVWYKWRQNTPIHITWIIKVK